MLNPIVQTESVYPKGFRLLHRFCQNAFTKQPIVAGAVDALIEAFKHEDLRIKASFEQSVTSALSTQSKSKCYRQICQLMRAQLGAVVCDSASSRADFEVYHFEFGELEDLGLIYLCRTCVSRDDPANTWESERCLALDEDVLGRILKQSIMTQHGNHRDMGVIAHRLSSVLAELWVQYHEASDDHARLDGTDATDAEIGELIRLARGRSRYIARVSHGVLKIVSCYTLKAQRNTAQPDGDNSLPSLSHGQQFGLALNP